MKKKEPETVTITKAEYELINWESTMFYEVEGTRLITPAQLAKLMRLDKKANG
jgi:PHD/YefM family antitoxin component YafN of YafNO toxin-antitoxin module